MSVWKVVCEVWRGLEVVCGGQGGRLMKFDGGERNLQGYQGCVLSGPSFTPPA